MKKVTVLLFALLALFSCGQKFSAESVPDSSDQVTRVEPLSWWAGMKTPLQLMIQGPGISTMDLRIEGGGLKVKKVTPAENPDFIFADVEVAASAKEGIRYLVFSKYGKDLFKYPYLIRRRAEGSASRTSFTSADMVYLIMPDRFANGDPYNDDRYLARVYEDGSARPWKVPDILEKSDRSEPLSRHGGDIQGIIDHLDYIVDLGATAIWITPLLLDNQERESYHGYACGDYYHIDPRFGDNALYCTLVEKAHEKGLKVIMDIVTNHCGTEHWWMKDMPFHDWIHVFPEHTQMNALFSTYMDPAAAPDDRERQESGWFVPSMPDMNLDNPYLLKYFQQWAIWWVEYAGLDGLRVDTYPYNEPEPMSKWCKAVTDEYPNINIVGECWDAIIPQLAYWQKDNPNKNGFNSNLPAIMDFPLRDAMIAALCEDQVWWSEGMTRVYTVLAQDFVYHDLSNMMTFFANHDHPRTGDILQGDPRKMKLAITMLATLRGIPQLYYGDEMMFMESPKSSQDGTKRIDFPGGWSGDAKDLFTAEGRAADPQAADLFDYTSRLFNWRKNTPVIWNGKTIHYLSRKNIGPVNYTDNTYAYYRYNDTDAVFVFINNAPEERALDWSRYGQFLGGKSTGRDVLTGEEVTLSDETIVPAKSSIVVEFKL